MRLLRRRALARTSMTVRLGLSSIQMGASASRPTAWLILDQSASLSRPLRTLLESTRASEHSSRWVSSSWLISSEKNSTGRDTSMAACAAMPSAREVFPAEGRAPMITSDDGWRPDVISSRSLNPVGRPVTASPRS